MDNLKNRLGGAFQKFNTAGKSLLSNLRHEKREHSQKPQREEYESLSFLRDYDYRDEIEIDVDCDKDFGILTLDDENDFVDSVLDTERRNDREEIRRKLAMDSDTEDYISEKLSQHRENDKDFDRLKGSGNLQICFMNEAAKDQDLPSNSDNSGGESCPEASKAPVAKVLKPTLLLPSSNLTKLDKGAESAQSTNGPQVHVIKRQRPKFFFNRPRSWHSSRPEVNLHPEEDLLTRHVRLQTEAREALAQAKDMARMQMEIERQKKKKSPIAEMVGLSFPDGKNFLSRHALVAMNLAQLQVIVNDLHSQIETLNEDLVRFLLERDDLNMEQDSMLVDIEDLTKYLGLKENNCAPHVPVPPVSANESTSNKKILRTESVRRSQSVYLKSKNLMWPLHQLTRFGNGYTRR